MPRNGRGRDGERPVHRDEERSLHHDEEWPPLAVTRESPRTNRRPNTAKNKEINKVAIKLKKKKKSLQIINTGEGVEKRDPSYTVGRNVNWYSHYGIQYGSSSKN